MQRVTMKKTASFIVAGDNGDKLSLYQSLYTPDARPNLRQTNEWQHAV